jgi:predicted amidohydrolase YtcJ
MRTLLLANARVITCDARDTIADTIAVRDGKVLAVGSEEAVRARAGPTRSSPTSAGTPSSPA